MRMYMYVYMLIPFNDFFVFNNRGGLAILLNVLGIEVITAYIVTFASVAWVFLMIYFTVILYKYLPFKTKQSNNKDAY